MIAAPLAGGVQTETTDRFRFVDDRSFFDRTAADVAVDLLGMLLVHDEQGGPTVGRIVEVEAYLGPEDLASHSARGRTPRTATMFGPPGHAYVYLVYGLHHCLNVVCGPGGKPEAVLLRAAQMLGGVSLAAGRRPGVPSGRLATGPGNLARAFGVDRVQNGADLLAGPLRIAQGRQPTAVERTARIGVDYAGEWARAPLRYLARE